MEQFNIHLIVENGVDLDETLKQRDCDVWVLKVLAYRSDQLENLDVDKLYVLVEIGQLSDIVFDLFDRLDLVLVWQDRLVELIKDFDLGHLFSVVLKQLACWVNWDFEDLDSKTGDTAEVAGYCKPHLVVFAFDLLLDHWKDVCCDDFVVQGLNPQVFVKCFLLYLLEKIHHNIENLHFDFGCWAALLLRFCDCLKLLFQEGQDQVKSCLERNMRHYLLDHFQSD